jgi:hypothetical protein
MKDHNYQFEVIELNSLGDHTVLKRFCTKIEAIQFADMLNGFENIDGSSYYVNDLEEEWREVANMILEDQSEEVKKEDNLWLKFVKNNGITY